MIYYYTNIITNKITFTIMSCTPIDESYVSLLLEIGVAVPLVLMITNHGYYVKPTEAIYDTNFEMAVGFGVCGYGFSKDSVVYYPSYENKPTNFQEVLQDQNSRLSEGHQYKEYLAH